MLTISGAGKLTIVACFITLLMGCAVKLAPDYDKAIVEGLTKNTPVLLEFFSSVSQGTERVDFNKREKSYNRLIGGFDALKLQSEARPVPANAVMNKANQYLTKRGVPAITSEEPASALALGSLVKQLTAMRENDRRENMSKERVELYKNPITTSLDQAITYESFLER